MSGVAIVREKLNNPLLGISVDSVYPVFIPTPDKIPCILLSSISLDRILMAGQNSQSLLYSERVQISIFNKRFDKLQAMAKNAISLLNSESGMIAGFDVDSLVFIGGNPDGYDEDIEAFSKSFDFMVKYRG